MTNPLAALAITVLVFILCLPACALATVLVDLCFGLPLQGAFAGAISGGIIYVPWCLIIALALWAEFEDAELSDFSEFLVVWRWKALCVCHSVVNRVGRL